MYLALKSGDHLRIDDEGEVFVHRVSAFVICLVNPVSGGKLTNQYFIACQPNTRRSLVGWDYNDALVEVTDNPVTCLECLVAPPGSGHPDRFIR